MSLMICITFARFGNPIGNTHHRVKIHVHVNEVCAGSDQKRLSEEENSRTVVVGAVWVDGWNLGDRSVEGGCQGRFMRHIFETL